MIRVVSWNVLADAYVRREYYPRTSPALLDAASRREAVARRLALHANADLVCLQEMDATLFALAVRTLSGFTGRLLPRRGRTEGCALFVRHALTPTPRFEELVFSDRSGHVALAAAAAGVTVARRISSGNPTVPGPSCIAEGASSPRFSIGGLQDRESSAGISMPNPTRRARTRP